MKLSIISENISRQDFFDFYALEYAQSMYADNKEINRNLEYLANHIIQDHLDQFGTILVDRLPNFDNETIIAFLEKYGISLDENYSMVGIDKLSLQQKIEIISKLVAINDHFGFTDGTWFDIGKKFLDFVRTGKSTQAKILTIDKMYNMLHHSGILTDYMEENGWLEDALHIRDTANPAQIFALASPRVRSLIGRATYHGMANNAVSDIQKIYSAFRRIMKDNNDISLDVKDDRITLTVNFVVIEIHGMKFNVTPSTAPDAKEYIADGIRMKGVLSIRDEGDRFEITSPNDVVYVPKPINRQYHLASDMINAAMSTATGQDLRVGIGISNIKKKYYINKKNKSNK